MVGQAEDGNCRPSHSRSEKVESKKESLVPCTFQTMLSFKPGNNPL